MPGSTPVYGFPYPEPTDLVADYPALGQQLAEDIEAVLPNLGGLIASPPTTIANSGGTATLSGNTVTFTTVNSVSLNGCFTGNYTMYRVLVGYASSASLDLQIRMRLTGTDSTASTYNTQMSFSYSSTAGAEASLSDTKLTMGNTGTGSDALIALDFYKPAVAANTIMVGVGRQHHSSVGRVMRSYALSHETATAYDGFTLIASANNMTGIVSVYGYKK